MLSKAWGGRLKLNLMISSEGNRAMVNGMKELKVIKRMIRSTNQFDMKIMQTAFFNKLVSVFS